MKCPECFGKGEIELLTDYDHKIPCPCCAYADALARQTATEALMLYNQKGHIDDWSAWINTILAVARKRLEERNGKS